MDDLFALRANDDNNFLSHGIAKGTLVVVNPRLPYVPGKLSVFRSKKELVDQPNMKLSKSKLRGYSFAGRVIAAITQYS